MYITNKTISLDKNEIMPILAVENDNKRYINFTILNNNIYLDLNNATITLYAINAEMQEIRKTLKILGSGKAQLELTSDLLKLGITNYQLKITYKDGTILRTKKMKIIISEDMEERR